MSLSELKEFIDNQRQSGVTAHNIAEKLNSLNVKTEEGDRWTKRHIWRFAQVHNLKRLHNYGKSKESLNSFEDLDFVEDIISSNLSRQTKLKLVELVIR